ncbi:hypothetical protein IEU95_09285 [Hoyosella rhizosphaerae]|uniref:peptidoglycan-binding domain-containing protein n=1 Tax=Hoyosella rhizosphaerae TaxID=1755582 RepID=UPI0019802DCD|nr:peptidoglycan-binding domain-containing protein [Hoyosella rhizosphaerae]MBN4927025.1 hypothetical protein [Hoyosella rhizosphaerae]
MASIAVLALVVGLVAGMQITSPADAASRTAPPDATDVAVPVERRALVNQVVARADASFEGAIDVLIEPGEAGAKAVVTGQVPEAGDQLNEGAAVLEVVGRPVIALEGELPMYRTLSPGMRGPDVLQLEQALSRLGLNPGYIDNVYTGDTARAVAGMYQRIGYAAPPMSPDIEAELDAARQAVREAERMEDAGDVLDEARARLGEAQAQAGTPLPISEVQYFPTLPRRVDDVKVRRGDVLESAPVMTASGADMVLTARINDVSGELIAEGDEAIFDLPRGGTATGTVTDVRDASGSGGYEVSIEPGELTPEQVDALRGSNVRVTIPVASTEGEVLVVPLAALTAGPGGESRIELQDDDGVTTLVRVNVGLSAQGFAEVTPAEGEPRFDAGDLVVVGR